ncbi:hypothetical protein PspLS_03197 [Pyricularia sp. CBS 133598]|nr:hypothetical protein PspLS_03197 [Pyricularia sp. CBS 133598]
MPKLQVREYAITGVSLFYTEAWEHGDALFGFPVGNQDILRTPRNSLLIPKPLDLALELGFIAIVPDDDIADASREEYKVVVLINVSDNDATFAWTDEHDRDQPLSKLHNRRLTFLNNRRPVKPYMWWLYLRAVYIRARFPLNFYRTACVDWPTSGKFMPRAILRGFVKMLELEDVGSNNGWWIMNKAIEPLEESHGRAMVDYLGVEVMDRTMPEFERLEKIHDTIEEARTQTDSIARLARSLPAGTTIKKAASGAVGEVTVEWGDVDLQGQKTTAALSENPSKPARTQSVKLQPPAKRQALNRALKTEDDSSTETTSAHQAAVELWALRQAPQTATRAPVQKTDFGPEDTFQHDGAQDGNIQDKGIQDFNFQDYLVDDDVKQESSTQDEDSSRWVDPVPVNTRDFVDPRVKAWADARAAAYEEGETKEEEEGDEGDEKLLRVVDPDEHFVGVESSTETSSQGSLTPEEAFLASVLQ